MYNQRGAVFIIPFLVCGLFACITVDAEESNASGYLNDPFTRPGIITPYTLPEAWPVHNERRSVDR